MKTGSSSFANRRGFTLLEVIIATAVAAIVLLVINATFFGALRLNNTTHAQIERDLEMQRTLAIVRGDLAGLLPPGGVLSGQFQSTVSTPPPPNVTGDRVSPDLFTTTGAINGWNPFSEVQDVAYFLAPDPQGGPDKQLVRAVTRNLLSVQTEEADLQTLLSGVRSVTMEFFDGTNWTPTWDSSVTATLPTAIHFSLVLAPLHPGDPEPAPVDLVVPVPVVTAASLAQAAGGSGS